MVRMRDEDGSRSEMTPNFSTKVSLILNREALVAANPATGYYTVSKHRSANLLRRTRNNIFITFDIEKLLVGCSVVVRLCRGKP